MKIQLGGIYFPRSLLDALGKDRLVVFAGAGVSMGEPANLPSFRQLTEAIEQITGKKRKDNETEDQFLGRLKRDRVNVHECVAKKLCKDNPQPTDLHSDLLRLFSSPELVRIVTTNFDLLFERAAKELFDPKPEVFRAPALPLGNKFRGVVHIHGSVAHHEEMILTDKDFGRAYLVESEGWARRFLVELFRSLNVLFVGYSHNDTIMNYLARALPTSGEVKRFALMDDGNYEKWQLLGIEPIAYNSSGDCDHGALYEGVNKLVEYVRWRISDWQIRIKELEELVEKGLFSLGEEEEGILDQVLSDTTKVGFFVETASAPQWVKWLDDNKYLDSLFGNADLDEIDFQLANWLAVRFAHRHPDQLFFLIGRHGTVLNPLFWERLARFIGQDKELWDKNILSRWMCLLLATAPQNPHDFILLRLGESCAKYKLFEDLVEIFDTMLRSHLHLEGYVWPGTDTDESNSPIPVLLEPTSSYFKINKLWKEGLKPNLDQVVEPLLSNVIRHLETQHRKLSVWGAAWYNRNPASSRRAAIEPNEQNTQPRPLDVLIDAARDCLEWLASNRPETAAQLCDRLVETKVPLFRRLALHTLLVREDLTPDEKIDWFLPKMDFDDTSVHHELFRVVTRTYPDAGPQRRQNVVEAVFAYSFPNEQDENKDFYTAGVHIDWLNSLHTAKPDCGFAKQALDKLRERFPNLQPSEHPDHLMWVGEAGWIGPQSPWTVEQLLSKPAEEWIEELLSFKQEEFTGPDHRGLVLTIGDAAKQDFQWGLALAIALTEKEEWDTDIWSGLLNAWSETGVTENQYEEVLRLLSKTELYDKHALPVARALFALVKNDGESFAPSLLSRANRIARTLWQNIGQEKVLSEQLDWLTKAINHPAGSLALFWLNSLSLWRKSQDPTPRTLDDEYSSALSVIVQDESMAGRLGRCVLAGHFSFLLDVDEKWTKENLLPLFGESAGEDDYHAAWSGFLVWQRINPSIAELLGHAFLGAVERIKKDYPQRSQRSRFVSAYVTMLVYFATNPIDKWIPGFFENADEADKQDFGFQIKRHLVHMDEARREELWRHWLKPYWENRLMGAPSPLEPSEISRMLDWLLHLDNLFPEAVDLAIKMQPPGPLEQNFIISNINKSDLWKSYPESVAKLLVYLGGCNLPDYEWYEGKELVNKLLKLNIAQELEAKLEDLIIKLRLT